MRRSLVSSTCIASTCRCKEIMQQILLGCLNKKYTYHLHGMMRLPHTCCRQHTLSFSPTNTLKALPNNTCPINS
jgi:hypothetical protein